MYSTVYRTLQQVKTGLLSLTSFSVFFLSTIFFFFNLAISHSLKVLPWFSAAFVTKLFVKEEDPLEMYKIITQKWLIVLIQTEKFRNTFFYFVCSHP